MRIGDSHLFETAQEQLLEISKNDRPFKGQYSNNVSTDYIRTTYNAFINSAVSTDNLHDH